MSQHVALKRTRAWREKMIMCINSLPVRIHPSLEMQDVAMGKYMNLPQPITPV